MTTDTVPLSVKWGKETLTLENFVVASGVKGLKTELEEKTRVPADRMKLMAKSKGKKRVVAKRKGRVSRYITMSYLLLFYLRRTLERCVEG
jgi:hypothetical protein